MAHPYILVYLGSSVEEVGLCTLKVSLLPHMDAENMINFTFNIPQHSVNELPESLEGLMIAFTAAAS